MPSSKSTERVSVAMALLKLDRAGFGAVKGCRAGVYCGGNKLRDATRALRDLFSTSRFAEEPTEMTLRISKLQLCGGRMR